MELLWVLMYRQKLLHFYDLFHYRFRSCTEIIDILARGVLPNNQNPGFRVLVSCQGQGVVCFVLAVGRCGVEVAT
jgi:hypothetical protein